MPRIGANITDISTEYEFIEPGTYRLRIKEVDVDEKPGQKGEGGVEYTQIVHIIKSVVVSQADGSDTPHENKPVYDYINLMGKDGEFNQISLTNLKRYFEACLGAGNYDANDPDTDELKGLEFIAEVYIDSYTPKGSTQPRQNNKLRPMTILPVSGGSTGSGVTARADDWAVPTPAQG